MTLITLVIYLIVVGALLYIVTLLPIDATIKKIIQIVVIVVILVAILVVCLWVLQAFVGPIGDVRIGR